MGKRLLVLCILLALLLPSVIVLSQDMPSRDALADGWTTIPTSDGTSCAPGTPYEFHVRPAASEDVLIFFNGGGACWNGVFCNVDVEPTTFTPVAQLPQNNPSLEPSGIFDLQNPDNPFANYNMVFLPYCTGDVFLGGGEQTYPVPPAGEGGEAGEITVNHFGYANTAAVLDWVYANYDNPSQVVVAGSSAGALGSSLYTGVVAERYPATPIIHIGDGAGGYRSDSVSEVLNAWRVAEILPDWGVFADADPTALTLEVFLQASATFENVTLALYNTAEDETQYGFLQLLGESNVTLLDNLLANTADVEFATGDIPTYIAGGSLHTILRFPEFYTYSVNDVSIRDWVAGLISGEAVSDVQCDAESGACQVAPVEG